MKEEIKAGSVVRLKTGGPEMKVKSVKDDMALCEWLIVGRPCNMYFKISSLQPEKTKAEQ